MSGAIVLLLATVFLLAATAKLRSRRAFAEVLRGLLPEPLITPTLVAVPLVEFVIAAALLSGMAPRLAVSAAVALLVIFTFVLVVLWRRGAKSCGCFGETAANDNNGSGVIRNTTLIASAFYVLGESEGVSLWGPDLSTLLARLTLVSGTLAVWVCFVAIYNRRNFIFNYSPPKPQ